MPTLVWRETLNAVCDDCLKLVKDVLEGALEAQNLGNLYSNLENMQTKLEPVNDLGMI